MVLVLEAVVTRGTLGETVVVWTLAAAGSCPSVRDRTKNSLNDGHDKYYHVRWTFKRFIFYFLFFFCYLKHRQELDDFSKSYLTYSLIHGAYRPLQRPVQRPDGEYVRPAVQKITDLVGGDTRAHGLCFSLQSCREKRQKDDVKELNFPE